MGFESFLGTRSRASYRTRLFPNLPISWRASGRALEPSWRPLAGLLGSLRSSGAVLGSSWGHIRCLGGLPG
eukprot:8115708-Pyramimonas_sp.AAC.1